MKWKEPAFGATPMLKALTTANAHRKAKVLDLVAEGFVESVTERRAHASYKSNCHYCFFNVDICM
ncbi:MULTISPECIES: hypothetical protein [unclassified Paenibacillus]|uniref:hypothetical protein n=1 Tax=unclassified Paenibacillus TaxID=185978 RepID=UPI0030D16C39